MKNIQKGDSRSFELLFNRYFQPLSNYVYLFLKDAEQTEEIVCDIFTRIWIKRNEIHLKRSVKAYLYKSAYNATVSYLRKEKPHTFQEEYSILKPDFITPETLLINQELETAIENLLGSLPKESGLVFRMKRVDGLGYKEIAEILHISEKTVEKHVSIAIKKIDKMLSEQPELKKLLKK